MEHMWISFAFTCMWFLCRVEHMRFLGQKSKTRNRMITPSIWSYRWTTGYEEHLKTCVPIRIIVANIAEEVVGLERGPLSLVSTTEELLDRKVAAPV
jgi:hypothetical protein